MLVLSLLALLGLGTVLWPARAEPPRRSGPTVPRRWQTLTTSREQRQGAQALGELADTLALMSAPIRIGVAPAMAVRVAIEAAPGTGRLGLVYDDLLRSVEAGENLSAVWLHHADTLASSDLRFVGQAWRLTELTGAPLASALGAAEAVLRARERSRLGLKAAVAGPRASMTILTLLPLCGPLVGLAFGIGPRELYLSSLAATTSLVIGVVSGLVAWVWSRRIVERAPSPSRSRH